MFLPWIGNEKRIEKRKFTFFQETEHDMWAGPIFLAKQPNRRLCQSNTYDRKGEFNPTPAVMAITPKNNDPKELELCDFSYISMANPPIPFLGLQMAKKGF